MTSAMRALTVLLLALLPSACAFNMYSDAELEPLSLQAYDQATKESGGEIKSGKDYDMVQRVAKRIAAASEEDFNWQVRLLKADDTVNAFCLPNGRIAVYTGIFKVTQNEDALAIVVGHEVAHAVKRHGGQRMTADTLSQGAMAALDAGLGLFEMSPENRGTTMAALGVANNVLVALPYSRGHETEADVEGLRYAIRAGYNPEEAPKLWERMAKMSGDSGPVWLSTHPASADRAAKLREMIPVLKEQEKNWKPKPKATPAPAPAQQPAKQPASGSPRK